MDLSEHPILGKVEVKISSMTEGKWHANIGMEHNFDYLAIMCMDDNSPWKDVERVYIIPEHETYGEIQIGICEDWSRLSRISRFEFIEKYRVDEKPYSNIYHNIDIPKLFSPFDLWNGRYNKKSLKVNV